MALRAGEHSSTCTSTVTSTARAISPCTLALANMQAQRGQATPVLTRWRTQRNCTLALDTLAQGVWRVVPGAWRRVRLTPRASLFLVLCGPLGRTVHSVGNLPTFLRPDEHIQFTLASTPHHNPLPVLTFALRAAPWASHSCTLALARRTRAKRQAAPVLQRWRVCEHCARKLLLYFGAGEHSADKKSLYFGAGCSRAYSAGKHAASVL